MSTIAIDALAISQPGGARSAVLNVLRELLRMDTARRYLLLLDGPEPELAGLDHVQTLCAPTRDRLRARLWAQATWPVLLRARHVDLVHHMKNLGAFLLPGRSVYTIFDLTMLRYPEIYSRAENLIWRYVQPLALGRADRVVAISQETARDVVRHYRLDPARVAVIYPAYNPLFRPLPPEEAAPVRARLGVAERYLLHVGSISKKKNLLTLLRAFEALCAEGYPGDLCLVGRQYETGHDEAFFQHLAASPWRARVVLTGAVSDTDLRALYSAADVMVFPSLHEGFGIAPLEAMACGCPVVCSAGGALPEVVGEGGLVVDAAEDAAWVAALSPLVGDAALRAAWRERGLAWVQRYSAREAARQTLDLYDELLGERSERRVP